jgi:hypothetical protein
VLLPGDHEHRRSKHAASSRTEDERDAEAEGVEEAQDDERSEEAHERERGGLAHVLLDGSSRDGEVLSEALDIVCPAKDLLREPALDPAADRRRSRRADPLDAGLAGTSGVPAAYGAGQVGTRRDGEPVAMKQRDRKEPGSDHERDHVRPPIRVRCGL